MQLKQELRLQFCRKQNLPKPFLLIYRWAGSRPLPLRGWWSLQFGARLAAGNDVKRQGARVSRHSSKACILASNGFALRPRIAEIALHDILSSWVGDNCRRGINQLVGLSRLWHHVRPVFLNTYNNPRTYLSPLYTRRKAMSQARTPLEFASPQL